MINTLFFIEGMNFGGQQTFMYNVFKQMQLDNHLLHTVYVFDGDMCDKYQSISVKTQQIGAPYDPFDLFKEKQVILKIILDLVKYIRQHNIKLIYSNGFCSFFASSFASLLTGVKHVRFIGGDLTKNEPFHFNNWKYNFFPPPWLTTRYYGHHSILNLLNEKGVSQEKLVPLFFPGGVDTDLFKPSLSIYEKQSIRSKLGISKDDFVIGWAGRIEKNVEIRQSLSLICELKKRCFNQMKFLIIGDGAWKDSLFRKAIKCGVFDKIIYRNFVPQVDLPQYIEVMDIVPLLDVDPIGGSKIREAMSCGTAVLSVDGKSGEQKNIIENGVNGTLVSPDNYIKNAAEVCIQLYSNRSKLKKQGLAGRKFAVENMSFVKIADRLKKEILSLVV